MTSSERKHWALARRLAREYTEHRPAGDRGGVQVFLCLPNERYPVGTPWLDIAWANKGRAYIGDALATLVEREIERENR
jgi:hypothetical protein